MTNEEILKATQNENTKGKEFENKTVIRSSALGAATSIILGVILFVIEYLVSGTVNTAIIAVGMTAGATQYLYEGIKTKKASSLIFGIIYALIAVFAVIVFVSQLSSKG